MKNIFKHWTKNGWSYQLVIDHDKKTVNYGTHLTMETGTEVSKKVLKEIQQTLINAGYKNISD